MRPLAPFLVAAAVAATTPEAAHAVDHVVLSVSPTAIPAPAGASARNARAVRAWRLLANVNGPEFGGGREGFGVTLERRLLGGRGVELHALRAQPAQTLSFDGRNGQWATRGAVGSVVEIDMRVTAAAPLRGVGELLGCAGGFVARQVILRGRFVVRTGTGFFGTIRLSRLRGTITYNADGPVTCNRPTPSCSARVELSGGAGGTRVSAASASGGWFGIQFVDPLRFGAWYHVVTATGVHALAGRLPTLSLRAPRGVPVRARPRSSRAAASGRRRRAVRRRSRAV